MIGALTFLASAGCKKELNYLDHSYVKIDQSSSIQDVIIPKKIQKEILGSATAQKKQFFPIKAYLIEKVSSVLGDRNLEFGFSKGGGELNLSDWVDGKKRGEYTLAVHLDVEVEVQDLKVYYFSRALKRKSQGEEIGVGCETLSEITSYFKSAMKGDGFLVSTVDRKDISVLAGDYYFIFSHEGTQYLSHLTVRDSQYPQFQCPLRKVGHEE